MTTESIIAALPKFDAMAAEPPTTPPTVAELARDCVDLYAQLVDVRARLTLAERAHTAALKAGRP